MTEESANQSQLTAIARSQLEVLRVCADGVHVVEQAAAVPYACAVGESDGARAVGRIELSSGLIRLLTLDELHFVLAHQCARIAYNHTATRAVWERLQPFLDDHNADARFDLATHFVSVRDGLPSNIARQQDHEADYIGVQLMAAQSGTEIRDAFTVAASALSKLAGAEPSTADAWDVGSDGSSRALDERLDELMLTCGVA